MDDAQNEVRSDATRRTSLFARSSAGGSAIVRGNQVSGEGRAHFGHQYGDRSTSAPRKNDSAADISGKAETHYHFYQQLKVTSNAPSSRTSSKVVGSALRGLSLASSGIGCYASAVPTIRRVRPAAKEFQRLRDRLDAEYDVLVNRLELLLGDTLDASSHRDLFESTKAWGSDSVKQILQQRLGSAYEEFIAVIAELERTVEVVRSGLLIDNEGKVPFSDDARQLIVTLGRLPQGLLMKKYRAQIKSVKARVLQIEEIIGRCQDLGTESSKHKGKTPDFDAYRQRAMDLFASLKAALSNECKHEHRASLALDFSRSGKGHSSLVSSEAADQCLLVHHDLTQEQISMSWRIAELRARLLQSEARARQDRANSRRTRIRFQDFREECPEAQWSQSLQDPQSEAESELQIIFDLCRTIQVQHESQNCVTDCLGSLPQAMNLHRYSLHWNQETFLAWSNIAEKTLYKALQAPEEQRPSILERRRLALGLGMAMLHLHDTPWMAKQWSTEDVLFDFAANKPMAAFLSVALGHTMEAKKESSYDTDCPFIRNSTIFSLGVILIELALEASLETLIGQGDEGVGSLESRFLAAVRLISRVEAKAGFKYADVVSRCVRCDFDHRECSLSDRGFREKVFLRVVKELEEEVSYLEPGGL